MTPYRTSGHVRPCMTCTSPNCLEPRPGDWTCGSCGRQWTVDDARDAVVAAARVCCASNFGPELVMAMVELRTAVDALDRSGQFTRKDSGER